jgi:hypothetical protein
MALTPLVMTVAPIAGSGRATYGLGRMAEELQPPCEPLIDVLEMLDGLAIEPLR